MVLNTTMPARKITETTFDEFFSLVNSGYTQRQAAEELGINISSIRVAADRLNIDWSLPRKGRAVKELIAARRSEILETNQTQSYWAKEFGVTQACISRIFKELGLSPAGQHAGDHSKSKVANARRVLEYILKNGGTVPAAKKALGITTLSQYIRDFAKSINFDLNNYRWAWQVYGQWMTVPGPVTYPDPNLPNVIAPAICTSCSHMKPLNLCNARSGRTSSCQACAAGRAHRFNVENTETGELHKSINAFVRYVGWTNRYQKIRSTLITDGTMTINGVEYKLIELEK